MDLVVTKTNVAAHSLMSSRHVIIYRLVSTLSRSSTIFIIMIRNILTVMQLILYIPGTRGPGDTTFDEIRLLQHIRCLILLNLFCKPKKI